MHQMFMQFHTRLYMAFKSSSMSSLVFRDYSTCDDILQFLDVVMYQRNPVAYILQHFSFHKIVSMQAYITHGYSRVTPFELSPIFKALSYFYSICIKLGFHEMTTDIPAQLHKALEHSNSPHVFRELSEEFYISSREVLLLADNLIGDFGSHHAPEPEENENEDEGPVNTEYLNDR